MFVALVDLRSGSPTERATSTLRLSAETPKGLFIPPGVAHGFLAETDLTLLGYLVDRYFDGTDESGIAWNDPELGIDWPAPIPSCPSGIGAIPRLAEALRDPIPYRPTWVDLRRRRAYPSARPCQGSCRRGLTVPAFVRTLPDCRAVHAVHRALPCAS